MNRKLPFILLVVFLALIVAGINGNDVARVLETAATICLSCMGIG